MHMGSHAKHAANTGENKTLFKRAETHQLMILLSVCTQTELESLIQSTHALFCLKYFELLILCLKPKSLC